MKEFINKIKQFFRNIISKNKVKKLEVAKEISSNEANEAKEKIKNNQDRKKEFFEIYNKVKNNSINLKDIKREDLLKIRKILLEESKLHDEEFANEIETLQMTLIARKKSVLKCAKLHQKKAISRVHLTTLHKHAKI